MLAMVTFLADPNAGKDFLLTNNNNKGKKKESLVILLNITDELIAQQGIFVEVTLTEVCMLHMCKILCVCPPTIITNFSSMLLACCLIDVNNLPSNGSYQYLVIYNPTFFCINIMFLSSIHIYSGTSTTFGNSIQTCLVSS